MKKMIIILIALIGVTLSACNTHTSVKKYSDSSNGINDNSSNSEDSDIHTDLFQWTSITYEQQVEVPEGLLVTEGTLTVATSPDFAPYEFLDLTQSGDMYYQGADIYLANFIAQTLGLKLEIVESSFDGLVTQLNSGKADVVFAGLSYTETRAESYTFTTSYYNSDSEGSTQVLITLAENLDLYNSYELLNSSDVTIGVQPASIQQELLQTQLPLADEYQFADINTGIQMLQKGTIDVLALSRTSAETIVAANSDLVIIDGFEFDDSTYVGMMGLLTKDNPLATYINEAIELLPEGQYEEWLDLATEYYDVMSS